MESVQHYMEGLQFLINANIHADIFPFQSNSLKNTYRSSDKILRSFAANTEVFLFFTVSFLCSDLL